MPFRFFTITAHVPGDAEEELNRFLRAHRIVAIERQFVGVAGAPEWCLAVEYVDQPAGSPSVEQRSKKDRIDYKEVLEPAVFARFSKLRELRKELAEADALPVYAIFTNEQLAQVAQTCPRTLDEFLAIDGIGEAKAKRYGERFPQLVAENLPPPAPAAAPPAAPPT